VIILRPRRRTLALCAAGLFLVLIPIGGFLLLPPSSAPEIKTILIRRGTPLPEIAASLRQEGLIRNTPLFIFCTFALGKRSRIKAGEYELTTGQRPLEILDTLVKGQVKRHLITIPEGFTLGQIAQLLDQAGIVPKEVFLRKATSPEFIASIGLRDLAGLTLEGFLFPETYSLMREMDPEEILKIMVGQFRKVLQQEIGATDGASGLTLREAVVLASIIEKETPLAQEKPLISAVFHNRLRRRMPLQSDPTVIYGIPGFDGNLTREHLMTPTPYNTYVHPGLPPTPIANPGKESLRAALFPATAPYLYFVSRNDGSHAFSNDLEEHNRAVWRYQKAGRVAASKKGLTKK
jgi:UPF0755 protein